MNLLDLTARVCREFSEGDSRKTRVVEKVKETHCRDVVTRLDTKMHDISEQFVAERLPGCRLLSEEGNPDELLADGLQGGEWLVVDPLDGSNNHAVGLPHFGYMAAHLRHGRMVGAIAVLPELGQYIVMEDQQLLVSKPLDRGESNGSGTVYYAYPPEQDTPARQSRWLLQELIDAESAGMYRYGSACAGLYHLLCGKHMAFIGHGIRLWDALAFLPILALQGFMVKYLIHGTTITLLSGTNNAFLERASRILLQQQAIDLQEYSIEAKLLISSK